MLGTVSPALSYTTSRHRELEKLSGSKVQAEVEQANFADKKYVWIPDAEKGYELGYVAREEAGDDIVVHDQSGQEYIVNINDTEKVNPPKFDKVEDMADLGYLNEASVVHNLKLRYYDNLIYTYSGLFLVAVNPYYNLPIYTDEILRSYRGKKRGEVPPHIFAISDSAYQYMLQHRENQAILITGESGAGKTENTKKVIQYLTGIASGRAKSKLTTTSLEQQILRANPILEAFGNAKTVRNNNSSRFGKFIRIAFNNNGQISGANIDWYLFEKSRVTHQSGTERNYHVFYQFIRGASPELKQRLLVDGSLNDYGYTRQSLKDIDGVDDVQDFKQLTESLAIMNFSGEQQASLFRVLAAVLHLSNIKVTSSRDDQAMLAEPVAAEKVCHVLGIPTADFTKGLLRPRVRAGRDWMTQARNVAQVTYSLEALARSLYERMFGKLIDRINTTIDRPSGNSSFIGVLDIAGFEIFEQNSFEQLCINYTNERLQQFFNHHMFVLEQDEYRREGIDWQFIDFGLDLQPTIDLIEKTNPIGILSCLDEECVMPKATDKTFTEKLHGLWKGRSPKYEAPRFKQGFIVKHYASHVEYSTDGWLDKNKDPLNENLTKLLAQSSEPFIAELFADYLDGSTDQVRGKGRGKRGAFRTVGQRHKEQLNSLMNQLYSTEPHFVRCILPNEQKLPKVVNTPLVLDQLRCNGVLEGIRICRQGFPNRLPFAEFRQRYEILAPTAIGRGFVDSKQAAHLLLEALQMDPSQYRIGRTKVFFRAGVLAELEEIRDVKLSQIISSFQAYCRGHLAQRQFRRRLDQAKAIRVIQKNARVYIQLREWPWWKLYTQVKPLLQVTRIDEEIKQKEVAIEKLQEQLQRQSSENEVLTTTQQELLIEKQKIEEMLEVERNLALDQEAILRRTQEREVTLEEQLREHMAEIERLEQQCEELTRAKVAAEEELAAVSAQRHDDATVREKLGLERQMRDEKIQEIQVQLDAEMAKYQALEQEKLDKEERLAQAVDALDAGEARQLELEKQLVAHLATIAALEAKHQSEADEKSGLTAKHTALELEVQQLRDELSSLSMESRTLNESIQQKSTDYQTLQSQYESAAQDNEHLAKQCRDLTVRLDALAQECDSERAEREKLHHQRQKLEHELAEVKQVATAKMDEESKQTKLAALREEELAGVRQELESVSAALDDARKQHMALTQTLKTELQDEQHAHQQLTANHTKLQSAAAELETRVTELRDQVQILKDAKRSFEVQLEAQRSRSDANTSELTQIQAVRTSLETELQVLKDQYLKLDTDYAESEEQRVQAERQLALAREELAQSTRQQDNLQDAKGRMETELQELQRRLSELEAQRDDLQGRFGQQSVELEELKEHYHTETIRLKSDLIEGRRQVEAELAEVKTKAEELERANGTLEKAKSRLITEVEDLKLEIDREHSLVRSSDKSVKHLEAQLKEMHQQVDADRKQRDGLESEIRKLRSSLDTTHQDLDEKVKQLGVLQRSKNDLEKELKGLIDEIGDGARNVHELEKAKRQLESQVQSLEAQAEFERAEREKVEEIQRRVEDQHSEVRQRLEAELQDKEAQGEESRRLLLKEVNGLGERLDEELAAKMELLKVKKKLETELADLVSSVDHSAKSQSDLEQAKKRAESLVRDTQVQLEAERKARLDLENLASRHEKKSSKLQTQMERIEGQFDSLERSRRQMEKRLDEVTLEAAAHLESRNQLQDTVKKLTVELTQLRTQLSEASEAHSSLEKARQVGNSELEYFKTKVKQDMESRLEQLEESRRALMAALRLAQQETEDRQHEVESSEAARKDLQAEVEQLKDRLETEILARTDEETAQQRMAAALKEAELKYQTEAAKATELSESLSNYRVRLDDVMAQVEDMEIQRHRAQKSETNIKATLQEWQEVVDKAKEDREAAEGQTRLLEERMLHLQAKMDEDALIIADLRHVRRRLEEEVQLSTEHHQKDLEEHEETMDALRGKYQKELEGLTTELEKEKATGVELRERNIGMVKQVEELEQQLEQVSKSALAFQREKERLEDKWNQLQGGYTETRASHTAVRQKAAVLSEQVSELTSRLEEAQVQRDLAEKTRKHVEQRLEELEAKYGTTSQEREGLEVSVTMLESETKQLRDQLEEERDISETAISKLNKLEEQLVDQQAELNRERLTNTELTKAKIMLEKKIKNLNLRLVDLETCSMADLSRGSKRFTLVPPNLAEQLDSEAKEKNETMRNTRKMERMIRELQFQLSERDKHKSRQDEEFKRLEQKLGRMKSHVDELESVENSLQLSKRRAERECEEQREYAKRLERELERIKSRFV